MTVQLRLLKLGDDVVLPKYESAHASGLDVRVYCPTQKTISIEPGKTVLVPTGLKAAVPPGYEIQVRPRSGLSLKTPIRIANTPGTVDADYRGEIGIIITNLYCGANSEVVVLNHGDKIAQLVVCPVIQAEILEVPTLDDTKRGSGGFGSTGVSS